MVEALLCFCFVIIHCKMSLFRKSEGDYRPFTVKEAPSIVEQEPLDVPRIVSGVPHYNQWKRLSTIDRDKLMFATKCVFMDSKMDALQGYAFFR